MVGRRSSAESAAPPRRGSRAHPEARSSTSRFDVVAVRAARRVDRACLKDSSRAEVAPWRLRRTRSTPRSTSSSRGRSAAARARADEARPSAAPVSRQVHPAARRGAARRGTSRRGGRVLDPFAGSGHDARAGARVGLRRDRRRSRGVQLPADAGQDARATTSSPSSTSSRRAARGSARSSRAATPVATYMRAWFAPQARARAARASARSSTTTSTRDVLRVVLARAARSARLTTHFDLDVPRAPQHEPYWCHKHKRDLPSVETRAAVPPPLLARHARRGSRTSRACAPTARARGAERRRA